MKKIAVLFFTIAILVACKDSGNGKNERIVAESNGRLNNLSVVISNDLWEGSIGENLRKKLAAPVDGLPQQEPLFSLNQIPPKAFDGFVTRNRTFLYVKEANEPQLEIVKDTFARPQTGIYVMAPTEGGINKLINDNTDKIISTLKNTEITEQQRRIGKSLKNDEKLKETLGVKMKFPTAYRYAKNEDDFFWIRKDIPHGSMEILVYEVPMKVIDSDTNVIGNIIKMRDSIGKQYIPGPSEGTFMITEEAYAPYLFESEIDGKFAYETKGTWEVKGAFMAGPFINYAVKDEKNNRYVILEGFVFRPSNTKRDHMFELESILKSAKIE